MPRPPKPLFLPDIVSSPKTRAEYAQSHPAIHGPASRSPHGDRAPPSPTSTNDANSHRASDATLVSLNSASTSTSTSWSMHNASWSSEPSHTSPGAGGGLLPTPVSSGEGKSWGMSLGLGGGETGDKKSGSSWKSWFTLPPSEAKGAGSSTQKHPRQKEIKLSPSMISASASVPAMSDRPVSSPYPLATDTLKRSSTASVPVVSRTPRVGSGLHYYTERNPAPTQIRVQIPDPADHQDHDRPRPPSHHDLDTSTLTSTTMSKQYSPVPDVAVRATSSPTLDIATMRAAGVGRGENKGPLSPPPTPPVHEQGVPHIRVSSGEDL